MFKNNSSERESRGFSENFAVFGTAFPEATDKDRRAGRSDAGQFVPLWKQEVRDEKGRRRLHGAFTGGFSAGYFNTVGSKEGWEPSNYTSSRSARNERKEAKPEDFMDEEDLLDMAGAKKLVATEDFDVLGGTERELVARKKIQAEEAERNGGLDLLGSSLISMIGPPKDSVGVRLLRKMGWRPGQGIGPRIKRRHKDENEEEEEEEEESDDENNNITFAPRDTPIENYQAKRDTYGLGYNLSTFVPEVAEMKRLREMARQKEMNGAGIDRKNRSAFGTFSEGADAFGLGVFDENDGEMDDVYGGSEPAMKNYHHAIYEEDEGGYTRDEIKAQQLKRKRQVEQETVDSKNKLKCSDGRPPLNGFIVSDQKQQIGIWHAPPKVPDNFTGHRISNEKETAKPANIAKESLFSFEERGNVLGEKPIETRSVFDYMPKHSKDKLDQAVSFFIDIGKDKSQLADFPSVPKDVANLALQGFIPFGDNPGKQARYKNYLENQAGRLTEDGLPKKVLPIPEGLTYEAGMKELDEFAKAARIFRPISAMMSGRFTSASETTKNVVVVNFEGGLKTEAQYRKEKEERAKQKPEPEKKQLTQEGEAAAMKMFGNLTRTVKPFYPNRLVCKRFNVRNPHPNHDPKADADVGRTEAGSKDALSKESMESLLNERLPLKFTLPSTKEEAVQPDDDPMLKALILKPSDRTADSEKTAPKTGVDSEVITNKATNGDLAEDEGPELDYERPSMDIFKAIFDNSDDSDDEEEDIIQPPTNTVDDDGDIIGPMPPPTSTVDITLERNIEADTTEQFRPMFKRASERNQSSAPLSHVVSEEFVVQPFKPRSSTHKRRHVSVSDEEQEEGRKRDRSSSSRDHKKSSSQQRKSGKHKRSRSRDRDESSTRSRRKRSRSPEEKRYRSSSHKKSKNSRRDRSSYEEKDQYEAFWVEKEPVIRREESRSSKSKEGRMRASDMW